MTYPNEVVMIPMEDIPLHPLLQGGKEYKDPRPDLEGDSDLWLQVIIEAEKVSIEFAKAVYDMRSYGTRLKKGKTGYIIYPEIDTTCTVSIWNSMETYRKYRDKLLGPYRKQLKEIFENLFEWKMGLRQTVGIFDGDQVKFDQVKLFTEDT